MVNLDPFRHCKLHHVLPSNVQSRLKVDSPTRQPPSREKLSQSRQANRATRQTKLRRFKWIASAAIVFHLLAVVLPPLAFQTISLEGPSPLIGTLIRPFQGYGQFLYLDRGYAFFAPDPGPSHLIQAAVTDDDGEVTETMYPDLDRQWPRLLYHRHFMLTEYLHEIYWPPGPPNEMFETDPPAARLWQQRRSRYEYVRKSMVDHLRHVNDGRQVAILRIEHGLPPLANFIEEPIELDDPRLYSVLLDQPIISDAIAPAQNSPNQSTEEIPAPAVQPAPKPAELSVQATPKQEAKQDSTVTPDRPQGSQEGRDNE